MNSDTLNLALHHWMALSDADRAAFARQCRPTPQLALPLTGWPEAASVAAADGPLAITPRPRASLPPGSGQRTPRVPVVLHDPALFGSQAYRRLAAETRLVHLYVASCSGTARLYEATRTVVYKAGTHAGTAVDTRIATLNTTAYASWRKSGQELVAEAGYTSWRAEQLPVEAPRPQHSPVVPLGTSIAVHLPSVIPAEAFDLAVTRALLPLSLAQLRQEPRIQLSLVGLGCDPDVLERYTARVDGPGHKLAAELVRVQPRRDAEALASMAEGIVATLAADHL